MNSWERLNEFEHYGDLADRDVERDDYEERAADEERDERVREIIDLLEVHFSAAYGPLWTAVEGWLEGEAEPEPARLDILLRETQNEHIRDLVLELKELFPCE